MVPAIILEVTDGDTIKVEANPWPGDFKRVSIRVYGIDTPELNAKCEKARDLATQAKKLILSYKGKEVLLFDVEYDKYGGRMVARVVTLDGGKDLAKLLLEAGLATPYSGTGSKKDWCK